MTAASERYPEQRGRKIVITRVLDAPQALVFEALIKPEHIKHWHHAGEGWTTPFAETDPRPGGKLRIGYGSPDGKEDFVLEGTYRELAPPGRIVYELADGRLVTTTLEDSGGRTNVTVELTLETEYPEEMQRHGWSEHLDNLATYLGTLAKKGKGSTTEVAIATALKSKKLSDMEIQLTRDFDAPRELVFKVMLDPKHIPQWWGPRAYTTIVDKMDVRVGGKWRFIHRGVDGDNAFNGEFREIVPHDKIVQTFEWEGAPGHISVDTMVFEDLPGGRTRTVATSKFSDPADLKAMEEAGAESGAREMYERLDELLATLQKKTTR